MKKWSVTRIGESEGVVIGDGFFEKTLRKMFVYIDRREDMVVRWLVKSGFLSEREPYDCDVCKVEMTRRHVTNECPYLDECRVALREALELDDSDDLEKELLECYFNMKDEDRKKVERKLEAMKSFIAQLYIKRGELDDPKERRRKIRERQKRRKEKRKKNCGDGSSWSESSENGSSSEEEKEVGRIPSMNDRTHMARVVQEQSAEARMDEDLDAYGAEAQQKRPRVKERETNGSTNVGVNETLGGNKTLRQIEHREVTGKNQTRKGGTNGRREDKVDKSTKNMQQAEDRSDTQKNKHH